MAQWLAQLQEYNLQIQYRAGRTHANVDALSRRPVVCAETRAKEACPCFTGERCRQAAAPQERAETNPPPTREGAVCAAETPAEGVVGPTDHPTLNGLIQGDVSCPFPGLDDEQLRQTQQRDPDLAAVAAALREKKSALPGPWSDLLFGVPPPQREEGSRPIEHLMETLRGAAHGPTRKERPHTSGKSRAPNPVWSPPSTRRALSPQVPRAKENRRSGGGDRRQNPGRRSHHLRGRPRGPGESRGPRGTTSWGQPRRGAPGTGAGTSGGYVVRQQQSRSIGAVPATVMPQQRSHPADSVAAMPPPPSDGADAALPSPPPT
uniref:Uncharacterized protein LOC116943383 n=1 Tax=Petromyzon marinus TaxID=7757 RepID=A0AAJ7T890_PETMA|nr:uncharacterized protein LOC116943383 [Petromyzon marinus]